MAYAYQVVVDDILRRIRRGEWREGERIPALTALERTYPQSRMTLYKALRDLTDRGYLSMERGQGTFVKAAHTRPRIAILTGAQVFDQGVATFAMHAFRHAHAYFARCGMDAQLYTEDPLSSTRLPAGLMDELDRRKLAGLMTVTANFPWHHMLTEAWLARAIPLVNIGSGEQGHVFDVDRRVFLDQALKAVRARGRRRVALLEREEHLTEHADHFRSQCIKAGVWACLPPGPMPPRDLSYEEYGYALLHDVWATKPRPEAVIVPDDVIAKGVSQAALALSIKSPEELLIIALTNRGSKFFYPAPILPIEVDVEALVATAARTLIDLINGVKVRPRLTLVPPVPPVSPVLPVAVAVTKRKAARA